MAIKFYFGSLSLGAAVDQQTGNLSVFELVEEIRTHLLPIQLQSLVLSLVLEKSTSSPEIGKILLHLVTPDGKQQKLGNGDLTIPAERKRVKVVFRFGGFPIHHYGAHRIVVSWTNPEMAKQGEAIFEFDVVQVTQVAQGVPPNEKPNLPN